MQVFASFNRDDFPGSLAVYNRRSLSGWECSQPDHQSRECTGVSKIIMSCRVTLRAPKKNHCLPGPARRVGAPPFADGRNSRMGKGGGGRGGGFVHITYNFCRIGVRVRSHYESECVGTTGVCMHTMTYLQPPNVCTDLHKVLCS